MCFSLSVSVAAGTALCVAGALTVRMTVRSPVRSGARTGPRTRMRTGESPVELPLALIPLLFGVQQLLEGVVWWSLDHHDPRVNAGATVAYLLFARVLWPVFVPFAIRRTETVPRRRVALTAALALGAGVALEGLVSVLRGPHTSSVVGSSIAYPAPSLLVVALYLVATCGGALCSSRRALRVVGVAALALALATLWLDLAVFVSVWCFCSAVLTVMIGVHLWSVRRSRRSLTEVVATP